MTINATPDPRHLNRDDYQRIAAAIAFMRENHRSQPDLAAIAAQVHLSEYHFQRLFTQWAGISPKRFLQYLTVEHAKAQLSQAKSLLDLSADVGLSSPGRLHDLFVTLEAMSPGEYKTGGANLEIYYGCHDSPFGRSLIATTPRGICSLHFLGQETDADAVERLQQAWPKAHLIHAPEHTQVTHDQVFRLSGTPLVPPLTVFVKGTNFQIQVWRALLTIPLGHVTTYQQIAEAIGQRNAARAIGNAVGQNPIAYLIPCHRVIRASGELGGYRWDVERKTLMLGWEACQITDQTEG